MGEETHSAKDKAKAKAKDSVMTAVDGPPEPRVLIPNLTWETYEAILRDRGDEGPRLAYDRGTLEVMSPSSKHERLKKVIARLVEAFTEELGIAVIAVGSTTFKSQLKERGLEPDECYYVQNEAQIREKETDIDLLVDPPPDVAIEVDLRRSSLPKLAMYAALGIPEVWNHHRKRVVVNLLQPSGGFQESERSAAFPQLSIAELGRFLERIGAENDTQIVRAFRAWMRERFKTGA
jgi:Uma2 family endonuclease